MATWIAREGEIPEERMSYGLSETTTDDKLTSLTYTPYYYHPETEEETSFGSDKDVTISDSETITAYLEAKDKAIASGLSEEEASTQVAEQFKPVFGVSGTWHRAGSGGKAHIKDQAAQIKSQYREMKAACSNYSGAQYAACVQAVEAKIQQMSKAVGFSKGGMVSSKETKPMMNKTYGYANGGGIDLDAIANQALDAALGSEKPQPSQAAPATPDISADMPSLMDQDMPMSEDEMMTGDEDNLIERIISVLNEEEKQILDEALTMHPELIAILDKADAAIGGMGEFDGEGPVSGPGTETSDSIPARLSDGEFVFTAKAVKQIGVDKLRKMMAKAEEDYDSGMDVQESEQMTSMEEEGFAMGGLLDQARKEWSSLDSATAEYNQPMEMQVPVNVDGAGRQVPEGDTGILAQRDIDLTSQKQTAEAQRRASNTGLMSANPTQNAQAVENERMQEQATINQNAQEEEQMP